MKNDESKLTPGGRHVMIDTPRGLVRKPIAGAKTGVKESTPRGALYYWMPVKATLGKVIDFEKLRSIRGMNRKLEVLGVSETTPCLSFKSGTIHVFDKRGNRRNLMKFTREVLHG